MESFDKDDEDQSKPVIMTGLKGQILRFGEHNIFHLRKELHAAVNENIEMTQAEKDLRKNLLDRVSSKSLVDLNTAPFCRVNYFTLCYQLTKLNVKHFNNVTKVLAGTLQVIAMEDECYKIKDIVKGRVLYDFDSKSAR